MAGNPPDVCRAPKHIFFLVIKDVLEGQRRVYAITTGPVHGSFWRSRRAGCIKDEQRILGVHFFWFAMIRDIGDNVVMPQVAILEPIDIAARNLDHDDVLYARR